MSHHTRLSEAETLRHQIDVYSTLVDACRYDQRPHVVEARERMERGLEEARAVLKSLKGSPN